MAPVISARRSFETYLKAFNESKFAEFVSFYAEDIVIYLNPTEIIQGRQAAHDFFQEQRKIIGEEITIQQLIVDETGIAIRCQVQFTAHVDLPQGYFRMPPVKKGQGYDLAYVIFYSINQSGKLSEIRAFRQAPPTIREA
ncbi:hypothetical protein B0J13DRAFT_529717 [Dactylonectria estremocensis]|uniref:SnoaL-like domain-containing protein n=1 Tax=Dactylonectria estremocensis TaxID=1079267 RepID=A0A9P9E5F2_9HYPO|nr:hypothetical protein B0J13DRAFT_529717 [Dactylonectria estremocensis]